MSLETRNISRKVLRLCLVTVRNQWEKKQHVQPQVVGSETSDPETLGVRSGGRGRGRASVMTPMLVGLLLLHGARAWVLDLARLGPGHHPR